MCQPPSQRPSVQFPRQGLSLQQSLPALEDRRPCPPGLRCRCANCLSCMTWQSSHVGAQHVCHKRVTQATAPLLSWAQMQVYQGSTNSAVVHYCGLLLNQAQPFMCTS